MIHNYLPTPENLLANGIYQTPLAGLFFIAYQPQRDERGFYAELSRLPEIEAVTERPFVIKQINLSSSKQNVIRGFHAESWNKLITIMTGTAFCVWVDVRPNSPTFGEAVTMTMGESESAVQGSMFVSSGLANSFCVLTGPLNYIYAVDALYQNRDPSGDVAISLFDPDLNIPWPIPKAQLIFSPRDAQAVTLKAKFPEKFI